MTKMICKCEPFNEEYSGKDTHIGTIYIIFGRRAYSVALNHLWTTNVLDNHTLSLKTSDWRIVERLSRKDQSILDRINKVFNTDYMWTDFQ